MPIKNDNINLVGNFDAQSVEINFYSFVISNWSMMFLSGFLSMLVVTFDIFWFHQSSGYLILDGDDTATEGNFLL